MLKYKKQTSKNKNLEYKNKYFKYKNKYLKLKFKLKGGELTIQHLEDMPQEKRIPYVLNAIEITNTTLRRTQQEFQRVTNKLYKNMEKKNINKRDLEEDRELIKYKMQVLVPKFKKHKDEIENYKTIIEGLRKLKILSEEHESQMKTLEKSIKELNKFLVEVEKEVEAKKNKDELEVLEKRHEELQNILDLDALEKSNNELGEFLVEAEKQKQLEELDEEDIPKEQIELMYGPIKSQAVEKLEQLEKIDEDKADSFKKQIELMYGHIKPQAIENLEQKNEKIEKLYLDIAEERKNPIDETIQKELKDAQISLFKTYTENLIKIYSLNFTPELKENSLFALMETFIINNHANYDKLNSSDQAAYKEIYNEYQKIKNKQASLSK